MEDPEGEGLGGEFGKDDEAVNEVAEVGEERCAVRGRRTEVGG